MSIATEISRIQSNKTTIRAKLVELGMATSTDNLTTLASAIDELENRGAVSAEIKEGTSYTIPAGYHNGSGTVKAVLDTEGDAEAYKTQAKTVTPTKKQQSVTPDAGYYALESVTVSPIPNAYQDVSSVNATDAEVLAGKIFVAANGAVIAGGMPNNGAVSKRLDINNTEYTIPAGYHNGEGKIDIFAQTIECDPTRREKRVVPDEGCVLREVIITGIPDTLQDITQVSADRYDVLKGKKYVDWSGVVEGTMPNNGDTSNTFDGMTTTSVNIPAGYTTGGTVSLTNDIENALKAI